MKTKIINFIKNKDSKAKKVLGVVLIIIGFLALVTPLTPGSWFMFVGLEIFGIRLSIWRKIKKFYLKNAKKYNAYIIPTTTLLLLVVGFILHFFKLEGYNHLAWKLALIVGFVPLAYRMLKDILKGHFGVDLIAIVAISASFFLGEYLAGAVVVLMLSGGEALENYALMRARKELNSLISSAPSIAHKNVNGQIVDVNIEQVKINDHVLVKPGEIIPVDGLVTAGFSEVDESALTGESIPVEKYASSMVMSGSINKHNVLEIKALKEAKESKYEQIIKLIKEAENNKAPVVRLADRYSVIFTVITFIAAASAWLLYKDPTRLLAVLVVATPCPLILATPIAIISGISKCASKGIIIKNGGALEKLEEARALIFDKTGTLTLGTPKIVGNFLSKGSSLSEQKLMQVAASLDQVSGHVLAVALTAHAKNILKLNLEVPKNFQEYFGDGVEGEVQNKKYLFGKLKFLESKGVKIPKEVFDNHALIAEEGKISVYLASEGVLLGAIYFADEIRPETKNLFADLKSQGLEHMVMLTGDKKYVAEKIGKELGLNDIHAEALPEDKVTEVLAHKKEFGTVAMIGDGVNDAPALAAADVGISVGGLKNTATTNTGDIVITVDNLGRVAKAVHISKQVIKIAKQGIFLGMGVSMFLMLLAGLGYIKPVYGALLQELLDVAVILNALRVNLDKS